MAPQSVDGHPHRARPRRRWLRCWQWIEAAWSDFLFLVLPSECLVCGAEDQVLCADCARELRDQTRAPFRAEREAPALVDVDGMVLLPVVAAGEYRDALATTILAFKNHGRTELARPLARALLRSLEAALGPPGGGVGPEGANQARDIASRDAAAGPALTGASAGAGPIRQTPVLPVPIRQTLVLPVPVQQTLVLPVRVLPVPVLLVPVPGSAAGRRRRGYEPVSLLLAQLRRMGSIPAGTAVAPCLRLTYRPP
jgi:predicted amidophosphoribosyltransferase